MDIPFVGRYNEIALLNELWQSKKSEFLMLYGRRRVGKSTLLTEWIRQNQRAGHPIRSIYWVADQSNKDSHLQQFSQEIFKFIYPGVSLTTRSSFASWDEIWSQLAKLASSERLAVFIDEFPHVMASDPVVASNLQRAWDGLLENANIFLCVSGSNIGMMQREFFDANAPLFGRTTRRLKLMPLPFGETKQFFSHYSAEEQVQLFSVFGGIPYYWRQINQSIDVVQNIDKLVFSQSGLLQSESALILHDSVKELQNYVAILKAIANGYSTPSEISSATGIQLPNINQYLSNLIESSFVARRIPVTASENTRLGRHAITDPFLRFYFRFVASRLSQIELGLSLQTSEEFRWHWTDFIGTYMWEELCREWVWRASNIAGTLQVIPDVIGSAWTKEVQIDIAGINRMTHEMILGECKWTMQGEKVPVLQDLIWEKTKKVLPAGQWRVYYLGFSKEGWNENVVAYARSINETIQKTGGYLDNFPWQIKGIRLLSLADVDADLAAWK